MAYSIGTSEVFQSYEEDCRRLQSSVREDLAVINSSSSSEDRVAAARRASEAHDRATQALSQMELEVESMGMLSASLKPKLRDYKSELASLRRKLQNAKDGLQREGLGVGGSSG